MTGFIHERSAEQVALDQQVLLRVKAGMALLEERFGPEWVEHIDLAALNLRLGDRCVLGQVYGDYKDGLKALHLATSKGSDSYGFSVYSDRWWADFEHGEKNDPWRLLQQTWERELRPLVEKP